MQTTWLALVRNAESITDPQAVLQWLIVSTRREAWRVVKRGRTGANRANSTTTRSSVPARRQPEDVVLR